MRRSERVTHNDWRSIDPRPVGSTSTDPLSVSVVVSGQHNQSSLDRCLAALAHQKYPADQLDVLISDDGSGQQLVLPPVRPEHTTIVPVGGADYSTGMARDVAARYASGDVVVFVGADMLDPHHVDAHVRWHELVDYAVVLGVREWADVSGVSPNDIANAAARGSIHEAITGPPTENHDWIERFFHETDDLCVDRDDLWQPVVDASVSMRRDFYLRAGGFAHHRIGDLVDVEFGYRCFAAGGLIVLDRKAHSMHQGQRAITTNGEAKANLRRRDALAVNLLPDKRYRTQRRGRIWSVPSLRVIVAALEPATFESLRNTVDDLLASDFNDLSVTIDPATLGADADLVTGYYRSDPRVQVGAEPLESGFPSPLAAVVPAGLRLDRKAVSRIRTEFQATDRGLLTLYINGIDQPMEMWRTRALERSRMFAGSGETIREVVRDLFGELAWSGDEMGVTAAAAQ